MTTPEAFADLPAPIRDALARRGFRDLTAVQRAVVESCGAGRDLRIFSQTGSGKTVAIGLVLADHFLAEPRPARPSPRGDRAARPSALVLVPTRELAAQIREELDWLYAGLRDLRVEVVTGGTSIAGERRTLAGRPALVVATPGRLLDHLRNGALVPDAIGHVVLDEADQMLDMGFREELDAILERLPAERRSHLVSATFPRAVAALAERFQSEPLLLEGTRLGVANADIQHIAYAIRRHEAYAALVNVLLMAGDERCLVFVNRRSDATDLAEKLARDGFGAAPLSGELPQAQRTRTLAAFRNGTLPILVSTEVAARGIDVPEIGAVIHVDPPRTADAYTHRSGRTGRAGKTGRSMIFTTPADLVRVKRLARSARVELSWQPIPTPQKVEKALRKRARRAIHERLANATPEEGQWMYAKQLLEDRDPVQVVATLLELTAASAVRDPMPVAGFDPEAPPRGRARDRLGPSARSQGPGRLPRRDREGGTRGGAADFTRFFVSWGEESGATTGRLLSHVCRRGGIASGKVGAIEIAARVSFVSIANDVASAFEAKVRRPDTRDPGIAIRRAHEKLKGSAAPPRGPRKKGPASVLAARMSARSERGQSGSRPRPHEPRADSKSPARGKRPVRKPTR